MTADEIRAHIDPIRDQFAEQTGQPPFELDEHAQARWRDYGFPGNVRELKNICIRLQTKFPGRIVDLAQLDDELDRRNRPAPTASPTPADTPRSDAELDRAMDALVREPGFSLDAALREQERTYIEAALRLAGGNISQAARHLGINRTTLYNRMDTLGLPRPAGHGQGLSA